MLFFYFLPLLLVSLGAVCVCVLKQSQEKQEKKLKILHFVYSKVPENEACGLTQRNTMHVYGPGGLG